MNLPEKIISGGQTGVDQGALDFALMHGLKCGGWCPHGRQCEYGPIPDKYPLKEVEVRDYDERTRRNIMDADATLVITAGGRIEKGTRLTLQWLEEFNRPFFHLDLGDLVKPDEVLLSRAKEWLRSVEVKVLNVAGNRESTSPGIQNVTILLLERVFGERR